MLDPGIRVRLAEAPERRSDLLSREGVVVEGLFPVARVPLQYNVVLRGVEVVVVVDSNSMELLDYVTDDKPKRRSSIYEQGQHHVLLQASSSRDLRKCALYFRNLNVSHELDDCSEYDDKWAVADQFDREICIMNAPMRKAPFKTSTIVQSFRTSKVSFQVA